MQSGADFSSVTTEFIKHVFGHGSEAPVYVCSLANDDAPASEPSERHVATREMSDILRFIAKWDRKHRGLFFCVSTINNGKRNKENVAESIGLHVDIDLKDIDATRSDVERILGHLEFPPSLVVFSGNGIHAYWLFTEPATGGGERLEEALRLLSDLLGGDTKPAHPAALMRLPGTHNTKRDQWTLVEVVTAGERRYELDDLEEWLARTSPKILRNERPQPPTNPFLQAAEQLGFKPSVDVEQRLSQMIYMGGGKASIHDTQLSCSSSMLNQGHSVEEVVDTLLQATRAAAGEYGVRWNWRKEENNIRKMCADWVKDPRYTKREQSQARPSQYSQDETARPVQLQTTTAAAEAAPLQQQQAASAGTVVKLSDARAAKAKKKQSTKADVQAATAVADGVINAIRAHGQDILLTEGEVWLYDNGTWHVMTPADQQWIMTLIQAGFEALNEPLKTNNLNAAYKRLCEHPDLFTRDVSWSNGQLICQNGALNVETGDWSEHSPQHYARRKIGAEYQAQASAPKFTKLLASMFEDRGENAGPFIKVIQQWTGAALAIHRLSREARKALLLVGPSRTGKTELSRIIRLLIGEPVATPSVAEISERFGLASLYEASAWIRDDAINEGDDLDPQRFKTIVTGEPIDIERKHRPAVPGVELALPVLLTTNSLPKARDRSDAIFNRSLILEMTSIVSEPDAHKMRQAAGVERGLTLGQHIFATEASGILNWALEGLRDLLNAGSYDLPETVQHAIQRFKDDNNPVGEWARTAVVRTPNGKVARHDLMCAYHGWQREQDGDEARAFGARAFFPRLRTSSPWANDTQDHTGKRFITGIHLTDEGLQLWELHSQGPQLKGGSKGSSLNKHEVNKVWDAVLSPPKPPFVDGKTGPSTEGKSDDKKPRF